MAHVPLDALGHFPVVLSFFCSQVDAGFRFCWDGLDSTGVVFGCQ